MDAKTKEAIDLLRTLIATPSPSRDESRTADLIFAYLAEHGAAPERLHNNVFARSAGFDPARPTLLLNSHHDTVRPAASYTRDPYAPTLEGDRLYGLGSNDAGASAVSLTQTFLSLRAHTLPFHLLLALSPKRSAWENTVCALCCRSWDGSTWQSWASPRGCRPPSANGGWSSSTAKPAAKAAMRPATRASTRSISHSTTSPACVLSASTAAPTCWAPIGIAVTQIAAGTQHNVVPDTCRFVADVRTTDAYTNEETVEILRRALRSEVTPRSTRIRASALDAAHPLARAAAATGRESYVSPTTSDMALMPFPSLKMGPGQSSRSHTADEFVLLSEIEEGIGIYEKFIKQLAETL